MPFKRKQVDAGHFPAVRELTYAGVGYKLGHQLAASIFSTVFEAKDEWSNPLVVKRYHVAAPAWMWDNEVANLRRFRHPLVTFMHCAFEHDGARYVVLERCGLAVDRFRLMDARQRPLLHRIVARDLLQALQFIHCAGYRHGDVKPSNILLRHRGNNGVAGIKLCDLAFTQPAGGESMLKGICNWSPPPEHFDCTAFGELGQPTDIYHASLLLLNLEVGELPLFSAEEILAGEPQALARNLGTALGDALAQGLAPNPGERSTAIGLWRAISKETAVLSHSCGRTSETRLWS